MPQPVILPKNGSYDFVTEWMTYADEEGRDLFFKFFCYFLAFNHLYEKEDLWCIEDKEYFETKDHVSELEKIISFLRFTLIDRTGPELKVEVDKDDFRILNSVRYRKPMTDIWIKDKPWECRFIFDSDAKRHDPRWRTVVALTKVYRVRCNLFHGEKHVTCIHDRELIECSNNLLGAFLRECASHHLGVETVIF